MKTLKKLPVLLALIVTMFAGACTEIDVTPRNGEADDAPIVIAPK